MIDTLLSAAHLRRELGEELFEVIVSSDNTGKVRKFASTLVALPTEITLGDRTYEILGFLREGETSVDGSVMVARAKEMGAHLGEEDGRWFLNHQDDIPAALRNKVFVFPDWRHPDNPACVYYVSRLGGRWVGYWNGLDFQWYGRGRLPRRK